MSDEKRLLAQAFVAGFRHSSEGYNGEYTYSDVPHAGSPDIYTHDPLVEAFEDWYDENVTQVHRLAGAEPRTQPDNE